MDRAAGRAFRGCASEVSSLPNQIPATLVHMVEDASIPVTLADPAADGQPLVLANDAFARLTGYGRSEVVGRSCRFLQGPDPDPAVHRALAHALAEGQDVACTLRNYTKRGEPFDNVLIIRHLLDAFGDPTYLMSCQFVCRRAVDATALRRRGDDESAPSAGFRQVTREAYRTIGKSRTLIADALFALAVRHLRRAENQAVLACRGFGRPYGPGLGSKARA